LGDVVQVYKKKSTTTNLFIGRKMTSPDFKSIVRKKIIYKLYSKFLLFTSFTLLFMFCVLDYNSQYDLKSVKYIFLYSATMVNLACLALVVFT